ncbi:BRO family protein [Basfia succiniciproducens]|uniref:BRO family protein n=1 Tax=Basfia succiniciproducens TaxID=653940 RepID=UPI003FCD7E7A
MTTQIQFSTFDFNSSAVRVITDPNQEHWFCGADVCRILGYVNESLTLQKHCKENGVSKRYLTDNMQRKQEAIFINEPNLYRLIIKSRKPEAEKFEAWVFEEVLPQIRKTGKYQTQPQLPLLDEDLPLSLRKKKYAKELTEEQWLRFASMWYALYNNLELLSRIHKPLEMLGSRYGITAYTHATEYQITLGVMKRILEPLLAEFNVDPRENAHYYHALKTLREYQPQGLGRVVKI